MSTLQNDLILEGLMDDFDIRPCFNGVGSWEVRHVDGTIHETYDTIDEAIKGKDDLVLQAFEDLCQ
tara:strand:- start:385 stop:582 length:198 start_codon:yes stop_codon:yes gene_type:complete